MASQSSKTYSDTEARERLEAELPKWRLKDGFICRTYRTYGWKGTVMLVNAIAHVAEVAWHHPDLSVSFNRLEVRLRTHDADGITGKDFALARKIEEMLMWRPEREDGVLTGPPPGDRAAAYIRYED